MKYNFYDDYSEGVHPKILQYISENNLDQQLGYSKDDYCNLGSDRIKQAFSTPDADVHFLPNGTIANVIGLVSMLKPFEGVISTADGHINTHEAGALEAAGRKIYWVDAPDGKLTKERIDIALSRYMDEHTVVPKVVYLTQATDLGTVYTKDELEEVIQYSKEKGLLVYVDGARLAMALTSEIAGITLEEFGQLDIDMFYVGGTKNGGLYGEAMVIKNDSLKSDFRNHMKQRGGMMAKGRFMGQQFARFFDEDKLWIELGVHANKMTKILYDGLVELGVEFDLQVQANQIFPTLPNGIVETLEKDYGFHKWQSVGEDKTKIRLVCSWQTQETDIMEFLEDIKLALT